MIRYISIKAGFLFILLTIGLFAQTNFSSGRGHSGQSNAVGFSDEDSSRINKYTLDEIKVISNRADRYLYDIPQQIEYFSSQMFSKSSASTISEILSETDGLWLIRDGMWGTALNIRGSSGNNIVTLVDGARIETANNHAAALSMFNMQDISSVEVLKSGYSSLYGTGATGGVINVSTFDPIFQSENVIKAEVSSQFNSVNSGNSNHVSINSASASHYLKIAYGRRSAGDASTPAGILKDSRFNDRSFSAGGALKLLNNHKISFNYQNFYASDVGIPGGRSFPAAATARYPEEKRELSSFKYSIDNLSENFSKISFQAYRQDIRRKVELKPNVNAVLLPEADHRTRGLSLQSDWTFDRHLLLAGVEYWQREMDSRRTTNQIPLNKIVGERPVPISDYGSLGFFVQDEYKFPGEIVAMLGFRYDLVRVTSEEIDNPEYIIINGIKNDNPPVNPSASFSATDIRNSSWSANFGMLVPVFDLHQITLNIGRSFRAPSLEERFQYINLGSVIFLGNPDLDPESAYNFDIGLRRNSPNIRYSINFYWNLFNNLVIDDIAVADSLYIKKNVGSARIYGFDASAGFSAGNFDFSIVAGYVRGEDTNLDLNLPQIPPLTLKSAIAYTFSSTGQLVFRTEIFTDQDDIAPGEVRTGGYTTFNLHFNSIPVKIYGSYLKLFCGIDNLTNKAYKHHLSSYRGIIHFEPGRNYFIKALFSI